MPCRKAAGQQIFGDPKQTRQPSGHSGQRGRSRRHVKDEWGRKTEPGQTRRQCKQKAEAVTGGKEGSQIREGVSQGQSRGLKKRLLP